MTNHRTDGARQIVFGALVVGAAALLFAAVLGRFDSHAFFFGYLSAFVLWSGVPLGCSALLMLHHLASGRWGWSIRGPLEAALPTLVLIAVLFMPVVFGMHELYTWARQTRLSSDPFLVLRQKYLNPGSFVAREAVFFGIWVIGGWVLYVASQRQDREGQRRPSPGLYRLAVVGMILYVLTVSFAGIDWVGSLEAKWYSSIFGLYILVGQGLAAMAVLILVVTLFPSWSVGPAVAVDTLHDLGNLLLALVGLHAYIAFSQFLIIWSGNLPHQVTWYLPRIHGAWGMVAIVLVGIHFEVPLVALLFREVKRSPRLLRHFPPDLVIRVPEYKIGAAP
jgi:hypothetical protein